MESISQWRSGFHKDLAQKLSTTLQDDRIIDKSASDLLNLCVILSATVPERLNPLLTVDLPDENGLVLSIMAACQRQLCSSNNSDYIDACVKFTVITLM